MNSGDMHAVQAAAARSTLSDIVQERAAPELQTAVAWAVLHGMPIKDVANAAHMTAMEVLDAADALNYRISNPEPPRHGQRDSD